MEPDGPQWSIVSASIRGASHHRSGLPNQDATTYCLLDGDTAGVIAAVADGHGGTRYVRSDRGSALAVSIACDAGAEFLQSNADLRGDALVAVARDTLIPAIVGLWRDAVHADLAGEPLTDDEQDRAGQLTGEGVYLAYGATLLVAAVWNDTALLLQLGDGDLVAVLPSGEVRRPVPDDPRLVAGETTSLGLPDAVESFRIAELAVVGADAVELLMLCTDGYGNSFADPEWRHDVGGDLLHRARQADPDLQDLGRALPAWLAESASAGGDDVTMALLHRRGIAPDAAPRSAAPPTIEQSVVLPPPAAYVPASPPPASHPRAASAHGPRIALAGIAALVLLAAGATMGWLWRGDDSSAQLAAPDGTDVTTTTTPPSSTSPPDSTPSPIGPAQTISTGTAVVQFDPEEPASARFTSARSAIVQKVVAANRLWDIGSKTLVVSELTDATRNERPLKVANFAPGGILYANGKIWLASSDGTQLVSCDTTEPARCDVNFTTVTPSD